MDGSQGNVGIVTTVIVVVDVQAEVGIARTVILTVLGDLIALCDKCGIEGMTTKGAVVIELTGEEDGLSVVRVADLLDTRVLIRGVFSQADDLVFSVLVCPDRKISRIGV